MHKNIAFIDGQNLFLGTNSENWKIDFFRFRVFLRDKYKIQKAYYFLGYSDFTEQRLYIRLQEAGFLLFFKPHNPNLKSNKKGNVDTDIVFEMIRHFVENKDFGKMVLISGDGDFFRVVEFLIEKNKFEKILFPNKKHSSLYKSLGSEFYDYLIKFKNTIELKKRLK